MNSCTFRAQSQRAAVNLAPSVAILGVIALGVALRVSWFELSWRNDVLFVLLALAALLPFTKLPLLFLTVESPPCGQFGSWAGETAKERAAQIELLEEHLKDSSPPVGATTR